MHEDLHDIELPRAKVFLALRDLWLSKNEKETASSLSAKLGMPRQKLHDYGTGVRPCPDRVLMWLAAACNRELRLRPDGVTIVRGRKALGQHIDWDRTGGGS